MKLLRFNDDRLGVLLGEQVADVSQALEVLPSHRYPLPRHDVLIAHLDRVRVEIDRLLPHAPRLPLAGLHLLSPVANPGKLVAAPVNYVKHLQEVLGDPSLHHQNRIDQIQRAGLFLKATSSLVGISAGVQLVLPERRTDHEVELAVVIGRTAKNVTAADALQYVAGYSIGLDITIRGPEERSLRKSPDSYSLLGPCLVTADELPQPGALALALSVGGVQRQSSNTSDLILGVAELIEFASRFYTLHPGDVIYTGTPEGVGPIQGGEEIQARIEGIGEIRVQVRA